MKSTVNNNFKKDCKIINLAYEYKGYTGKEKYAIITDLSEEELNLRYSDEIEKYHPFVILSRKMGIVIRLYQRNEEKYKKRRARGEQLISCDGDDEIKYSSLTVEEDIVRAEREYQEAVEQSRIKEISGKALHTLTPIQQEYIVAHFIEKKSYKTIAHEKGISLHNVWKTTARSMRNYIKAVRKLEVES